MLPLSPGGICGTTIIITWRVVDESILNTSFFIQPKKKVYNGELDEA